MPLKDIVVHVDDSDASRTRLQAAARLAARHGAHLTGLFVLVPPTPSSDMPFFTLAGMRNGVCHEELQRTVANEERALVETKQAFEAELARTAIKRSFLVLSGATPALIDAQARCCDLIIVGQDRAEEPARLPREFPAHLALTCGRPVLVLPSTLAPALGERILVAWNGTREAARALSDAMPLLEHASFIRLVYVAPPWRSVDDGLAELAHVAEHLKRCGINAESFVAQAPEHAAGDAIVAQASEASCDLIVMGAYGHSHMRELALGGATRTLLSAMPVALLLSH